MKSDLKLVPLTPDQWAALGDKPRWDVMSALRGPDVPNSDQVKWFTTSVIRGKCREVFRVGGMVNEHLPLVVVPVGAGSPYQGFDGSHFFSHVKEAARWLQIPILKLPSDLYWMRHDSFIQRSKEWAEYVPTPSKEILLAHAKYLKDGGY